MVQAKEKRSARRRSGGLQLVPKQPSAHSSSSSRSTLFLDDFCVWGYFCRRSFLILQVGADFLPGWASGAGKRKGWDRMGGGGGLRFGSSKDFFKMLTLIPGHWYGFHNTQSDKSRAPLSLQSPVSRSSTLQLALLTERYHDHPPTSRKLRRKNTVMTEQIEVSIVPKNACLANANIFASQQRWISDSVKWQGFIWELKTTVVLTQILRGPSRVSPCRSDPSLDYWINPISYSTWLSMLMENLMCKSDNFKKYSAERTQNLMIQD